MPQNRSLVFNNVMSRGNTHDHGDTTSITLNSLAKRDAEPCAAGKPCPDKRYAFSIMLLARTAANNHVVGMNKIPCFFLLELASRVMHFLKPWLTASSVTA